MTIGRSVALWLLLVVVTLAAYWPALRGGLVWDDDAHVTKAALRSWAGLGRIWFELGATQQYYPVLHSAFWLEHRLWGDAVLGYHLLNVGLHAACAGLLVLVVRRLALPGAWLAGLLFALHPVHVESVAWITEQKNTLSLLFYLLAALAYLRFDRERQAVFYWIATGLFALMLLTKTVTASLPAALLVVFWWQRGRLDWRRDLVPLVPWFVLGAAGGLFTAWVERALIGADGAAFDLGWVQRALLAGRVVWFYLGKLFWPAELIFTYPRWTIAAGVPWQYLFPAALLALLGTLWALRTRGRGPLAGLLIFGGSLFPVLGFFNVFPFKYSYVADHFQYLASLGVIVPVAAGLAAAWLRLTDPGFRRAGLLLAALLLAALALLTRRQAADYRDSEALYRATLARNPASFMAHSNLGVILALVPEQRSAAIAHFSAALRINPDLQETHYNLANALSKTPGQAEAAIAHYHTALKLKPDYTDAHNNLAILLMKIPGQQREAIGYYEIALRLRPSDANIHFNLALALLKQTGRLTDAITHLEAVLRLQPNDAEAHNKLGEALLLTSRSAESRAYFEAALLIKPAYRAAKENLAKLSRTEPTQSRK